MKRCSPHNVYCKMKINEIRADKAIICCLISKQSKVLLIKKSFMLLLLPYKRFKYPTNNIKKAIVTSW